MKKDVVIIGGGPSGLALACLLSKIGLDIAVIEKAKEASLENPDYDGRETALTHPSVNLLTEIGAWKNIDDEAISPIKAAKVLNGYSDYSLDFDSNKAQKEALGYLVSNHMIRKGLFKEVSKLSNVELITDTLVEDFKVEDDKATVFLSNNKVIETKLVAGADSRFSKSRSKAGISADMHDFARNMIVCKMEHENDHGNVALECFYENRVMAVLPLHGKTSSIVITLPKKEAEDLVALSEQEFNEDIAGYFEKTLGKLTLISKRFSYPLVSVFAKKFAAKRFALIGDAAVGMHPVTAHGFNLGLSGQNILYHEIAKAVQRGQDIGSKQVLEKYHLKHLKETKIMYHGTNSVVALFTSNRLPAKILRSLALRAANSKLLPFKSMLSNRLTGNKKSEGILPSLIDKFLK